MVATREGVPDAAEEGAGLQMGVQDLLHGGAPQQIGVADDRSHPGRALGAGGGLRGQTGDEAGLAHRPHRLRTLPQVLGAALQEDGALHPVPGAGVGPQVVEQVAAEAALHPEVVVGVDDGKIRLEDLFAYLGEPVGSGFHGGFSGWLRGIGRWAAFAAQYYGLVRGFAAGRKT